MNREELQRILKQREQPKTQKEFDESVDEAYKKEFPQSREDLLIQFMNTLQSHYEDMKLMAHQHAKLAADLVNLQLTQGNQDPYLAPDKEPETLSDVDSDLLGGEIGAD